MAKALKTVVIAPIQWMLEHQGLLLPSWRGLRQDIRLNNPGIESTLRLVKDGVEHVYERPEGTKMIDPTGRWYADGQFHVMYSTQDIDSMLAPCRHIYLYSNMTKEDRRRVNNFMNLDLQYPETLEAMYGYKLPVFKGTPRVQVVSRDWFRRSPLRKILYSITQKGIYNVFILATDEDRKPYTTMEEYSKSIQAFDDFNGTIWFNGKVVYSVYDIIHVGQIAYVNRESDIAYLRQLGTTPVILSNPIKVNFRRKLNKYGKPYQYKGRWVKEYDTISNDGRFVKMWRLQEFYEYNPESTLFRVVERDGACYLEPMLPEQLAYQRSNATREFYSNPELDGMDEEERDEYYQFVDFEYALKVEDEYSPISRGHSPNPEQKYIEDTLPHKITIEDKSHYVLSSYFEDYRDRLAELGVHNIEEFKQFCREHGINNYVETLIRVKER